MKVTEYLTSACFRNTDVDFAGLKNKNVFC